MKYIGEKKPGIEYEKRRTSYGLIFNEKEEMAVVYIEKYNMYNLIGGAIEEGEDSRQALIREAKEETGYILEKLEYIEKIGCYWYFDMLDKYELGIMDFYKAKMGEKVCESIEKDHKLKWVKPERIADKMYFPYHKYIVKEIIKRKE